MEIIIILGLSLLWIIVFAYMTIDSSIYCHRTGRYFELRRLLSDAIYEYHMDCLEKAAIRAKEEHSTELVLDFAVDYTDIYPIEKIPKRDRITDPRHLIDECYYVYLAPYIFQDETTGKYFITRRLPNEVS